MNFLVDAMFPPEVKQLLAASGHTAVSPSDLGAANLPDELLIEIATSQRLVIVTENASDFAHVNTCTVVLVRKSWWPRPRMAVLLAVALHKWAGDNPDPGPWPHWLEAAYR
jgi:hypothetical protein